jgi:hypothetical protein
VCLAAALSLAAACLVRGGPVSGSAWLKKIEAPPHRSWSVGTTFKGGERATVIVSGTGASYLGLYVYDEDGNCVARDDLGDKGVRDDLTVVWYPPRTAPYRIEVRNFGARLNQFDLVTR